MLDKIIIILPKEANVEPKRMISLLKWFQKWVSPNIKKISLDKSDLTIHAKNLLEENARLNEEIKQLNNRILISQSQAPEKQRLKIIGSSCCQYNPEKDKISFCIKQLKKAKALIGDKIDENFGDIYFHEIEEIFDNQIKQLRGKHD